MHALIDRNHKIIFFWSPRCGCTSIKQFYASLNNVTVKNNNVHTMPIDCINTEVELAKYNNYQKIFVVRNPFSRLISFFFPQFLGPLTRLPGVQLNNKDEVTGESSFNKVSEMIFIEKCISLLYLAPQLPRASEIPISVKNAILKFKETPTFKNFVYILKLIPYNQMDVHVAPQHHPYYNMCLPVEKLKFDVIVDVENLNFEFQRINSLHGNKVTIPHENKGSYYTQSQCNIGEMNMFTYFLSIQGKMLSPTWEYYYDDETKKIIEEIFDKDFMLYKSSLSYKATPAIVIAAAPAPLTATVTASVQSSQYKTESESVKKEIAAKVMTDKKLSDNPTAVSKIFTPSDPLDPKPQPLLDLQQIASKDEEEPPTASAAACIKPTLTINL